MLIWSLNKVQVIFLCLFSPADFGSWAPGHGALLCPETRSIRVWTRPESHLAGSRHSSGWNRWAERSDGPDFQSKGLTCPVHGTQKVPGPPLHCGTGWVPFIIIFDPVQDSVTGFILCVCSVNSCPGSMRWSSATLIMTTWMLVLFPVWTPALVGRYAGVFPLYIYISPWFTCPDH